MFLNPRIAFRNIAVILSVFILFSCSNDVKSAAEKSNATKNQSSEQKMVPEVKPVPVLSHQLCKSPNYSVANDSLAQFIRDLKTSIKHEDTTLLLSLMDSSVVSSHGGGIYGYDGVLDTWSHQNIWEKLNQLMEFGGAFSSDSTFRYPYFTITSNCQKGHSWTEDHAYSDPYITYFTIADTVSLFSEPTSDSDILAKLTHCFVNRPYDSYNVDFENNMIEVETLDKQFKGFVSLDAMFRTGDYNLIIERDSIGSWSVVTFAPYD